MSIKNNIMQRKGQGKKKTMHSGSPGRRVKMKSYAPADKASSSGRSKREKMQEDLDILLEKGILGSDFSWSAHYVKGKPFEENPGESESDEDIPAECVGEEESDVQEVNGEVGGEFEEDHITCYLREVSAYPLLSPTREMELAQIIRQGQDHLVWMVHVGTPHRPPSRLVTRALLLLALLAASLTLTHCRMVGDRLTGIDVNQFSRRDDCTKACRNTYKAAISAEKDRHKLYLIACAGNQGCIAAENARHQAELQAIEAAYRDCLYQCHLQGGGTAGD